MNIHVTPPRTCPACGDQPRELIRMRDGTPIRQCRRCLLAWWDWPAFEPADLYDRDYFQSAAAAKGYDDYAALEPGLRRTARTRLRHIAQCRASVASCGLLRRDTSGPQPPRLLEIGCGVGLFLDEARRAGWAPHGIEVSRYAAERTRQRGLSVECRDFERSALEPDSRHCVALWDVLEHLRDPAAVLRSAGQALRVGGVLALSTGDVTSLCARLSGPNWHLFNLPEHLFFFSPTALRCLFEQAGCRIVRITRETTWLPMGYLAERLRKTRGVLTGTVRRLLGIVARGSLSRWTVPATLLDVLGVYAVRGAPKRPFKRSMTSVD